MIRDHYLDINKIIEDKKILRLFRAVENHGGVLRFVGGSVRDALTGKGGFDLDLATDLSPEELVEACDEFGMKTVPIGIKFGTVGVIINDKILEVTSLRKDVKTDGRHAEVEFTTDWEQDASRRDLTINAVYADEKGNVFDYYNGIDDLEKGVVRFIGSPSQRIKEDYLRILRFFRFYSIFGKGEIDKKALAACIDNREGLKTLSMERIRDEVQKILLTPNVVNTLKIMIDNEIMSYVLPHPNHLDKLEFLVNTFSEENLPHEALRRMFMLYLPDVALAESLATRLKLTKKQKQKFVSWAETDVSLDDYSDEASVRNLVYRYGKEFCVDKLLLLLAFKQKTLPDIYAKINFIEGLVVPVFPIRGKDLIAMGMESSCRIGDVLDNLEQLWIESGFNLSREELLALQERLNKEKSA